MLISLLALLLYNLWVPTMVRDLNFYFLLHQDVDIPMNRNITIADLFLDLSKHTYCGQGMRKKVIREANRRLKTWPKSIGQ